MEAVHLNVLAELALHEIYIVYRLTTAVHVRFFFVLLILLIYGDYRSDLVAEGVRRLLDIQLQLVVELPRLIIQLAGDLDRRARGHQPVPLHVQNVLLVAVLVLQIELGNGRLRPPRRNRDLVRRNPLRALNERRPRTLGRDVAHNTVYQKHY